MFRGGLSQENFTHIPAFRRPYIESITNQRINVDIQKYGTGDMKKAYDGFFDEGREIFDRSVEYSFIPRFRTEVALLLREQISSGMLSEPQTKHLGSFLMSQSDRERLSTNITLIEYETADSTLLMNALLEGIRYQTLLLANASALHYYDSHKEKPSLARRLKELNEH